MVELLYILAAVVAALAGTSEALNAATPAFQNWKHTRCLVRIAVLERDLGIELTNPELLPRPKNTPQAAADRWRAGVSGKAANYTQTVTARKGRFPVLRQQPKDDSDFRPMWRRY